MHVIFRRALYIMSIATMFITEPVSACFFPENQDTIFGVSATRADLNATGLQIPQPEKDGKIATLNQTGFMTPDQNKYTLDFIDFVASTGGFVADIGPAYGETVLLALKKGARVVAADTDSRHLLLLRERTPLELRQNLILKKASFPCETNFPAKSLMGFHLCRVAHFWDEDVMEKSISEMDKCTLPGGRICVVTMSPHHHLLKDFLPVYLKKAAEGHRWPGVIHNMHDLAPHLKDQIPNFLHVMDKQSLGNAFKRHGFTILKEGLFDYTRPNAKKSDDKGYYGIIVEKQKDRAPVRS